MGEQGVDRAVLILYRIHKGLAVLIVSKTLGGGHIDSEIFVELLLTGKYCLGKSVVIALFDPIIADLVTLRLNKEVEILTVVLLSNVGEGFNLGLGLGSDFGFRAVAAGLRFGLFLCLFCSGFSLIA